MNPEANSQSAGQLRAGNQSEGDRIIADLETLAVPAPWVVLTGAPSAGKSSVISVLEQWGFAVRHEVAESARLKLLSQRPDRVAPWREAPADFTKQVLREKIQVENAAPRNQVIFWDRALPDTLPFCERNSVELSALSRAKLVGRYSSVLVFEPLQFEASRFRDPDDGPRQQELGAAFERAYEDLGYSLLRVPRMSIQDRAQYVLEVTGRLT